MVDLRRLRHDLGECARLGPAQRTRRICQVGVAGVPVAGAAISLMADANRRDIVYASDAHATELEELEFGLGEGPCVQALSSGRPVLIADLDAAPDRRWPMFAAAARARTPARAAFAFPLQVGGVRVGTLDLYRVFPGLLDRMQLTAALLVADAALASLLSLHPRPDRTDPDGDAVDPAGADGEEEERDASTRDWPLPLDREHAVVYQATGLVLVQAAVAADAALAILRAYAFAHDRQLRDVATAVVACRLDFTEEDA